MPMFASELVVLLHVVAGIDDRITKLNNFIVPRNVFHCHFPILIFHVFIVTTKGHSLNFNKVRLTSFHEILILFTLIVFHVEFLHQRQSEHCSVEDMGLKLVDRTQEQIPEIPVQRSVNFLQRNLI